MNALIIETQEIFRLSLKEIVSTTAVFQQIIEAAGEKDFLTFTAKEIDIDLIIFTPDQLSEDGSKWLHLVRRLYPEAAIIAFYNRGNPAPLSYSDKLSEMLPRDSSVEQTLNCLYRVMNINAPTTRHSELPVPNIAPNITKALINTRSTGTRKEMSVDADMTRLSFRQRQILAMAADGLPNKEIAARLDIAEGTVKAHMHAIFKVLGVTNRTQAVLCFSGSGQGNIGHSPAGFTMTYAAQ